MEVDEYSHKGIGVQVDARVWCGRIPFVHLHPSPVWSHAHIPTPDSKHVLTLKDAL